MRKGDGRRSYESTPKFTTPYMHKRAGVQDAGSRLDAEFVNRQRSSLRTEDGHRPSKSQGKVGTSGLGILKR